MNRDWQNWDVGQIAEKIDQYWLTDIDESLHRDRLADLVALCIDKSQAKILEVGCGTGLIYQRLVPNLIPSSRYVGVDVSDKMLDIARRRFPEGQFLRGDGYELAFDNGAFDVVLCFEVLGHIPEIETFLGHLLRVSGRICIFTVWPSDGQDIVESAEHFDGRRFLHRQYSDRYIRQIIHRQQTDSQIRVVAFPNKVTAYIVRFGADANSDR